MLTQILGSVLIIIGVLTFIIGCVNTFKKTSNDPMWKRLLLSFFDLSNAPNSDSFLVSIGAILVLAGVFVFIM